MLAIKQRRTAGRIALAAAALLALTAPAEAKTPRQIAALAQAGVVGIQSTFSYQSREGTDQELVGTARSDEPLRDVVMRMATTGNTKFYVIDDGVLLGVVTLEHMLKARARHMEEETRRERMMPLDGMLPPLLRPGWNRLTALSTHDEP